MVSENNGAINGIILKTPSKELKVTLFSLSLEPYYKQEISFCHANLKELNLAHQNPFGISVLEMTILIILQRTEDGLNSTTAVH